MSLLTARSMAAKLSITAAEILVDTSIPRVVRNREAFFDESEVIKAISLRKECEPCKLAKEDLK